MAFFKFRWPGQSGKQQAEKPARRARAPQAETVEVMRRRARHRLIGAAVLVLVGVMGFPLLFDTQPRPIAVDIPIEIPDRNKVAPLFVPAPVDPGPVARSPAPVPHESAASAVTPARSATSNGGLAEGEEWVKESRGASSRPDTTVAAAPAVVPRPEAKPEPRPEPKLEPKPEPKAPATAVTESKPARPDDAARARALLEGRAVASPAAQGEENRFIVQVGAFADADKAREVRAKVEGAGLKTYTQVVDTKEGKRTRVRVGPYTSRADADKAVARIRALDLPASVLTL